MDPPLTLYPMDGMQTSVMHLFVRILEFERSLLERLALSANIVNGQQSHGLLEYWSEHSVAATMRKMLPRMSKLHTIYDVCGILDNFEGSVLSEKNTGPLRFWNEVPPGYQYDCECYVR